MYTYEDEENTDAARAEYYLNCRMNTDLPRIVIVALEVLLQTANQFQAYRQQRMQRTRLHVTHVQN